MKQTEVSLRAKRRAKDAFRMRRAGLKLKEIGERIGSIKDGCPLSVERTRQLVVKGERVERHAKAKEMGVHPWHLPVDAVCSNGS